jgi:asparagine synthase (glutamine-hydrolysing)
MCGIIGAVFNKNLGDKENVFVKALSSIRHRGPDDEGLFIESVESANANIYLGHRRLSIIDLSPLGHQPMISTDGSLVLVFNGEIYNYRELKTELIQLGYTFKSDSDTEVLLYGWKEWKENILHRITGMFAFALYDKQSGQLTCVRDAFGIKPLYYSFSEEKGFSFASEIGAVKKMDDSVNDLNYQRLYDYLLYGIQDSNDGTFFQNIQHLPPASIITYDIHANRILSIRKWWEPRIETKRISFSAAVDTLRGLFIESVKLHMVSDVPTGAALSGGVDSSAIVCTMRHIEPDMPIHTFSYIASDDRINEEKWIDIINTYVGAIPHKVHVGADDFMQDFDKLIQVQGEPFNSTSIYAQYRIFQEARKQQIPVILEGQGADELLAGYNGYPGQRMRSQLEKMEWIKMVAFADNWKSFRKTTKSPWRSLIGQLLPAKLHSKVMLQQSNILNEWIDMKYLEEKGVQFRMPAEHPVLHSYGNRVKQILAQSLTGHELPSLLRFGDRNAMAFSIENRVPFLTTKLADFLLSLPEEYLISQSGESKHIFRQAMRGIVPDSVLDRRDKIGFVTPMTDWLKKFIPASIDINNQQTEIKKIFIKNNYTDELLVLLNRNANDKEVIWRMINYLKWTL